MHTIDGALEWSAEPAQIAKWICKKMRPQNNTLAHTVTICCPCTSEKGWVHTTQHGTIPCKFCRVSNQHCYAKPQCCHVSCPIRGSLVTLVCWCRPSFLLGQLQQSLVAQTWFSNPSHMHLPLLCSYSTGECAHDRHGS